MRATESFLDQLHALVATGMFDELSRAIERAEQHPDDPDYAVPPQLLAQAARFLAANGVSAPATAKRVEDLAAKLTEYAIDLDDEVLSAPHRH